MSDKRKQPTPTPYPHLSDETIDDTKQKVLRGVGYGQPPKHSQFKKGQSGNPKGRPKLTDHDQSSSEGSLALLSVLKATKRSVKVRESGNILDMIVIDALSRTLLSKALSGEPRTLALTYNLLREAEREQASRVRVKQERVLAYKAMAYDKIAEAKAAGQSEPIFLPHPDDIRLDDEQGYRITGPMDEAEQRKLDTTLRMRDILIMQDALDERLRPRSDDETGGAILLAVLLNQSVPKRLQLSDIEIIRRQCRYQATPKRELLKTLFRSWHAIGATPRRGFTFPKARIVEDFLVQIYDFIAELMAERNK